jgi:hypothetical protein
MKCSTLPNQSIGAWSSDYSRIAQQVLGPVTYTATVKVDLGDFGGDTTGIPVVAEITGTDNVLRTVNTTLDDASSFTISDLLPDMYSVAIKPSHWLRYVVPAAVSMPAVNTTFDIKAATGFTFINGDIFEDNFVDESDFGALSADWYLDASSASNPNSDLNGDGFIDESDYAILSASWYLGGD